MRTLYYECLSGISGDMNLGAMIDLGVDKDFLIAELNKLRLDGWDISVVKDQRHGIYGTRVTVDANTEGESHRHLHHIKELIESSSLSKEVKNLANKIFLKVAEAEAKVHNTSLEKVHFHEVGAIDSIIDIVGAAICYINLNINHVIVSPVELGGGKVECAHGILPVPAPATAEIIRGIPVSYNGVDFEATTPTGAAILATLGNEFSARNTLTVDKTGYGIGQKANPGLPNVLRVYLGHTEAGTSTGHSELLIEANIDDMNPEFYDNLFNRLLSSGARDVFLSNIMMKKNRPAIKLSIITDQERVQDLMSVVFSESTTLGIRVIPFEKHTLSRKTEKINTPFGKVTVKYSFYNNMQVSAKPEIDECKDIAELNKRPLKEVYNEILKHI